MIEDIQSITISYENNIEIKEEYQHLLSRVEDARIHHTFGILMNYLEETQKRNMAHLQQVEIVYENEFLQMDFSTKQNLELTQSIRNNSKSLTLWSFLE